MLSINPKKFACGPRTGRAMHKQPLWCKVQLFAIRRRGAPVGAGPLCMPG